MKRIGFLILLLSMISTAPAQQRMPGTVAELIDGKTVVLALPTGRVTVELRGIDVPEEGQPLYQTVRDHLQKLVVGKQVSLRLGGFVGPRMVGELHVNGVDVGEQMLRDGAAWHLPLQTSGQDPTLFAVYEAASQLAKQEKRGVWSVEGLKPTWQIRAENEEREKIQQQTEWAETLGRTASRNRRRTAPAPQRSGRDVGSLIAQHNEKTKSGYVATPYFGVMGSENEYTKQLTLAVSFSYSYSDVVRKGKKTTVGKFSMHVASMSERWRFIKTGALFGMADERTFALGRPKRISRDPKGGEVWTYGISRNTIDKMINSKEAYLRSGTFYLIPTMTVQLMLYNLLQEAG
jgi:endonuclease YncB( thermonuclease family)